MASTIELTRPVTTTGSPEAQKARLVKKAAVIAAERLAAAERGAAERIVGAFYEHVPPADVAAGHPRDLAGAALSLWRFAARRRPGQAKVRVFNPETATDGWSSPQTIVEIANDDMPFLVDSVTAAINTADRVVHLVVHPLPEVARDAQGRLIDKPSSEVAETAESWMHIEITREQDPAQLARLAQELAAVLVDVRTAIADWAAMRRTLRALRDQLSAPPAPPVPPAEAAEVHEFLRWLDDDNFTFLGYREYDFGGEADPARPALGILRDPDYQIFGGLRDLSSLPADVQAFVRRRELLVVTKSNRRATVHRRAHMDAIGLRRFGRDGTVVGVRLFLGLFTAPAYSRDPRTIPLLRQKVRRIVERAGLSPASHDGKTLLHILDTLPRDDLFQGEVDELFATAIGVLNLQERQRIALFVRRDPLERFVSCLVYAPRERYDTGLRQRFAAILERAFAGSLSAFYTHLDDSVLARIQFIIRTTRGAVPTVDVSALERALAEAGRTWSDRFAEAAAAAFGEEGAQARLRRVAPLPVAYQVRNDVAQAIADLPRIDAVLAGSPLEVSLHSTADGAFQGLRLYRAKEPVVLSDVLPLLENLGLRVIAEEPFRIDCLDGRAAWIHEFQLADTAVASPAAAARFEEALGAIWAEREENDGFNRLVLAAGLTIRQVGVLRLYGKLMRQAGSPYSQAYMEDALGNHPEIGRRLVRLFETRFDPDLAADRSMAAIVEVQAVDHALDGVASLDEDRILRSFLSLILKTVRTNYFQRLPAGTAKPYLAVKLASSAIEMLPRPRPLFEIYVSSPRVEAVHMRAGKVARGGIRWSDRKEDFRTEILGLMKAQTVKNAVIVPVGAKGGFVVKRPPKASDRLVDEAVECYRLFMRGLLDLTDNIVADGPSGHRVEPPPAVVRYDDDDPYLVVAADKGTAAFSDFANAIAEEYGFWLGDAFASGGSAGYDHKALAITARGAWELVKRHLRELGHNPETDELSVVGVGDMSGDVFGNGMLMSRHFHLVGAFDHRHVFVDPEPDPETGFIERQRLFRLPRSSWADYDRALISPGGGVFERSLKSIPISAEMKRRFDISADRLTPTELIRELLTAAVDLLWFGGIGTFVKAPEESHADVGDRANDGVRVDGDRVRAKVVGEGANLAVTERGRVAYALAGGRIDTDAIDNSAGVDTSDHEVNIKILVDQAVAAQALPREERAPLLLGMAADVAALVLRDNYLQGAALSLAEAEGPSALERQVRLIHDLERRGLLDRALEFLPDDKAVAARAAQRSGLVRPELAVLLAYAKLALDIDLLASDLPEAPELAATLAEYFPAALRDRFASRFGAHPLRREIVATAVANDLVNRAGLTFAADLAARTGRAAPQIARAYLIVRDAYALRPLWAEIEALDNRIPATLQSGMLRDIGEVVAHAAGWLLRGNRLDIGAETARLRPAVAELSGIAAGLLPLAERALYDDRVAGFAGAGVPAPLARRLGQIIFLTTALEIGDLAASTAQPTVRVAQTFYGVGARFALDDLRSAARRLPSGSGSQKAAAETLIDDFYGLQTKLTRHVLSAAGSTADPLGAWFADHAGALAAAETVAAELRGAAAPDLAMLIVAARRLRQVAD